MSEDIVTNTTEATAQAMFPSEARPHFLDDDCRWGKCEACAQNISLATLAALRELDALLRPFAAMAQTRMGLLRGFTRGT